MFNRLVDVHDDEDFLLQITYEDDPNGGYLIFGHSQIYNPLTPSRVRKLRKIYRELESKLTEEGHTVIFMQLRNLHFANILGCHYDVLDVEDEMRLIACPLLPSLH